MCVYIYSLLYMCVCMYSLLYMCVYICSVYYICVCIYVQFIIYVCVYVQFIIYICVCIYIFSLLYVCVYIYIELCPTLCSTTDCSLPGFSVHEMIHARIPEYVGIFSSRGMIKHNRKEYVHFFHILFHCGLSEDVD